jgi:hypothetical protein
VELDLTGVKVITKTGGEKAVERDAVTGLIGVDESGGSFQDVAGCLELIYFGGARAESFVRQVS